MPVDYFHQDKRPAVDRGARYVMHYRLRVYPNASKNTPYKGMLRREAWNTSAEYQFLSFNDFDAYAHMLEAFRPEDPRALNLQGLEPGGYITRWWCWAWRVDDPALGATGLFLEPGHVPAYLIR